MSVQLKPGRNRFPTATHSGRPWAYPSGTGSCPSTGWRIAAVSKCWLRHAKPSIERETLRSEIERDGEVLRLQGTVRDHPALKHELANRAFVVRTLVRLGLNFEPVKPSVGRPGYGGIGLRS